MKYISVNAMVLHPLEQEATMLQHSNDLEHLAGLWSADDARAFEQAVKSLTEVDPEHI